MDRTLKLRSADLAAERLPAADEDVHFPRALVQRLVHEYSAPGDCVLDPFAGFGTTLAVAAELGRKAVGIELLPDRVEVIRQRVGHTARVIVGDARNLPALAIGPVDLCITSPPYMTATGHPKNPLNGYRTLDGDYRTYLEWDEPPDYVTGDYCLVYRKPSEGSGDA